MKNKVDRTLLELVYEVSEQNNESNDNNKNAIEPILIGGRALNMQLTNERTSQDSDFIIRKNGDETSKNQLTKFTKSVKNLINEKFNKNIVRVENKPEHIEFTRKKIDHYVEFEFMFRIVIFISGEEYKLEISSDITAKEFTFDIFDDKFKVLSLENILALKTVISAKRIDEGSINRADNVRHIYDVYRILLEKSDFNNKRLNKLIETIHMYETTRKQENDYEYLIEKDDIKSILIDYVNDNVSEILALIKDIYGIADINREKFVNTIGKLIK